MLAFVGVKMLLTDIYKVPIGVPLGVIALTLAAAVFLSLLFPKQAEAHSPVEHDPPADSPGQESPTKARGVSGAK